MGFNLMQGEGLLVNELIAQDHSLLDPLDSGRGDISVEAFLDGDKDQLFVLSEVLCKE